MDVTEFSLAPQPATMFGVGAIDRVADMLSGSDGPVLLVADPAMTALGVIDRLVSRLAPRAVTVFDTIKSDPTEDQVEAGIAALNAAHAQTVVALGGGSALDAAKAIAVLAKAAEPVSAYRLGETPLPKRQIGLIAIPTTAGTGSEATRTAIITGSDHVKYWFWGDPLDCDAAILDPALTVSLPTHLTAATGADALVHAIESSTNMHTSLGSQLFSLEAIRILKRSLPRAMAEPEDMSARGAVLWASYLAGCAINQTGCALAHCFGHALGSMAPVHHGRAVSIAMAAGGDQVAAANPAAFAQVAEAMGADPDHQAFAPAFRDLMAEIGLDLSLPADATNVTPEGLVKATREPANVAMLDVTVGELDRETLELIAERIVATTPAFA